MAFDLGIGDGRTVRVNEPVRGTFPSNLGGAVEYSLVHFVYKVFEIMGGALGKFGAGVVVQFLEVIEPSMIDYVSPLIDRLVSLPDMPPWFTDYLNRIRSGEHEVGAALLSQVSSAAVGSAAGGLVGSLLSPVTYGINHWMHPFRPDPSMLLMYKWRGHLPAGTWEDYLGDQGYADFLVNNGEDVLRPRLSEGGLAEARRRNLKTKGDVSSELSRRGYTLGDAKLFNTLTTVLLSVNHLIVAMRRKIITEEEAKAGLRHLGYAPKDTTIIVESSPMIPPIVDLIGMATREAWRDDIAAMYGYDDDFPGEVVESAAMQGLNPEWVKRYWRAHWKLPSVTLGYDMFHRRIISEGDLRTLLKISDYPSGWRDKMVAVAYKPFTRVDVRRMYGVGVLNEEQVYEAYLDLGYDPVKSRAMTDFTILYASPDNPNQIAEARSLTRSVIEKAYRKEVINRAEAVTRLGALEYTTEDIDLLLEMIDVQRELDSIPDYIEDYQKDLQKIVLRSYTRRMIGASQAKTYLLAVGLSDPEIDLQLAVADFNYSESVRNKEISIVGEAYVKRAIDRTTALQMLGQLALPSEQQNQVLGEWQLERSLRTRRLTESQYRKALKDEIIGVDDYRENLRGLGYTEMDIGILVSMAVGIGGE